MSKLTTRARRHRSQTGNLAEAAAGLWLLTTIIVAGVFLLLMTGSILYFKLKLSYIVGDAARIAAHDRYWMGFQRNGWTADSTTTKVKGVVNNLLPQIGLTASTAVTTADFTNANYVKVTVKTDRPALSFIPPAFVLSETAVAPYVEDKPPATLTVGSSMNCQTAAQHYVVVPCYGKRSGANGPSFSAVPVSGASIGRYIFGADCDICVAPGGQAQGGCIYQGVYP